MPVKRVYKLFPLRKAANIPAEDVKKFMVETLRNFGGLSLLSLVSLSVAQNGSIEINSLDEESADLAHSALALCGTYREMKCSIREVSL